MRALCVLLLLAGCSRSHPPPQPTPPSGEVWVDRTQADRFRTQRVERRKIDDTLLVGGRIAFDDLRVSHVFAPVAGRITQVLASPGERVKKGTPLAIIASPDAGSALADLAKAKADLEAASRDLRRQKELYEAHAGSQKDYEAAVDTEQRSRAEFERARARARLFHVADGDVVTQEFTLRAPIDGEVVSRTANPGVDVQGQLAGGNTVELFTIGELDRVYVLADVHELDLSSFRKGDEMRIRVVSYPDRVFVGRVDWISAALDPQTRTARVRCVLDNPERLLKPEMYASLEMHIDRGRQVAVPKGAVIHLQNTTLVFVAKGTTAEGKARFERRPVEVDDNVSGDYWPVHRGLDPGEVVVVDGALLLSQVG
ncbi:MAG TPA: efflux RND transporter periplasmic adaptor subunit [Myxococcaceae bacterium]|nr:efflux RND transporter periplasmic adaptor subunit [Myxococcaceae bacterium]